jgi:hypothetical protein
VTQDGAGKLGEEALDEIEPGAVFWREREVEAACRSRVEPSSGFPRDVCGMIVADQLDRGASPRSSNRKRGIPQQIIRSITAGFIKSIVV